MFSHVIFLLTRNTSVCRVFFCTCPVLFTRAVDVVYLEQCYVSFRR